MTNFVLYVVAEQPSADTDSTCSVTQLNSSITIKCECASASTGFLGLLQDTSRMERLITAQVLGEATELSFKPVPPGNYLLTVLPLLQDSPACSTLTSSDTTLALASCAIHTELVLVAPTDNSPGIVTIDVTQCLN